MIKKRINRIYKIYNRQLLGFISKRVPDLFTAEDILQDVYVKVQTRINTLNDEKKTRSWLFKIARNAIIDYYRKEKCEIEITEQISASKENHKDDAYERLQLTVLSMIQQLPLKYRQALFLADYKGLAHKEIAIKLNVSLTCVKSRVQRARKLMKDIYLKCCHFEFDVNGKVTDYHPR